MERIWEISRMDSGDVRLRGGSSGLLNLDVTAPVRAGRLHVAPAAVNLDLTIALDRVKTGNFLTEQAARAFISGYRAHDLVYAGSGTRVGHRGVVKGPAKAGTIDVEIELQIAPIAADWDAMAEIEIVGSAGFGRVSIPLPGVGTVDDLVIDIDARLAVQPVQ